MRRLAAIDWLLLVTLMPLLLFGVGTSVVHGVRGDFVLPPFLASSARDAHSYPVVSTAFPSIDAAVTPGDRVLSLEGRDLRGLSVFEYLLHWSAVARSGAPVLAYTIEHRGARTDLRAPFVAGVILPGVPWWALLPFVLTLSGTGVLLLVRAAHWHLARRAYVTCVLTALGVLAELQLLLAPRTVVIVALVVLPLVCGLALWSVHEVVPDVRLWNPWRHALSWTLSLMMSVGTAAFLWLPDAGAGAILTKLTAVAMTGFGIAYPVTLTQVYRRSQPLGRRQIKWIVYGFYVGFLPLAVFFAVYAVGRWPEWLAALFTAAILAEVAVPLGVLVAVAFYQFLDIDRLFSATLSYSVLAIAGLAILLGLMPTVSRAASEVMGIDPANGQLVFALGLAAIVIPAHRIVRPRIDGLLFPERVNLEAGFERLLTEISSCADAAGLMNMVSGQLDALLRPISAVTYARSDRIFAPMAVRGRAAPPAFPAQSGLIATLQERAAPLAAERWTARRTASLTPFERATLETLDVAVLLPIRRGANLIAFSCLGAKRSGDIYTPTDLALLGAVAGKVSDRLLSLDAAALAEQAHAMQAALRRYVPGAVAQRVVEGQDLAAEEREVTVLFVDIRGYTGFSEQRQAEEIFRTVNRYTETVSKLVQARRGVVVEFHGDGMLAVFGAPDDVPSKEQAAVEAARDIVTAISGLPEPGGHAALSVGVGIATGPAFVGNIQSADRFIWTVIGNTTNLAARLQSLTRDLDAAVAIDDATFRRARRACADFIRHGDLAIRGRLQPETVHTLPLGQA